MENSISGERKLPLIGDVVLRDGYKFRITSVMPIEDQYIVASITLRGESGEVEIGYYDYQTYRKS